MKYLGLAVALIALPAAAQTTGAPQPGDVALLPTPDGRTQLTLITPGGYVGFTAGDWAMNGVHGALPAETFEFQVPDAADHDTDDSTNISLAVYQPGTRQARDAQAQFGKSLEPAGRPKKETYKD